MPSIAIVQAHSLTRSGIELALAANPALTVVASVRTAAELEQSAADYDVLILDLAGQPADLAAALVGSYTARCAVLAVLGGGGAAELLAVLRQGARGAVTQGTEPAELLLAVDAVARGAVYLAAELSEHVGSELRTRRPGGGGGLTLREIETLRMVAEGFTHSQIARRLGLTEATVNTYVKRIRGKLQAGNKAELTRKAITLGYAAAAPRPGNPDRLAV
jgi:DNA-binding NarL/FixJ family response regulator